MDALEQIVIPFIAIVVLFALMGTIMLISIWNYYTRKEAVKKLARTLKTDTENIADRLEIVDENRARIVKDDMKLYVKNEVKSTYRDIAHDIALLTVAVKDIAKESMIDAAKKDVIVMRLESEMRVLNKANYDLKEEAKVDATEIKGLKEDAKTDAIKIDDLKEEAKVDTANIERLEHEK